MSHHFSSLRRECRVACSPRAQPLWFRLVKWTSIFALAVAFGRRPSFWWCMSAAVLAGLTVHFFYRWKTCGWTHPWGGWDDLDAGRG